MRLYYVLPTAALICLLGIPSQTLRGYASCVSGARFQKMLPPNNRNTVDIVGSNLKQGAKASDVQSFGIDAAGKNGPIHDARSTKNCSGTQCTATIMDLASWEQVMVQMRCGDGSWSGWVEVDKTLQ